MYVCMYGLCDVNNGYGIVRHDSGFITVDVSA